MTVEPPSAMGESEYAEMVGRVRTAITATVPGGASVLVISKGDEALLDVPQIAPAHFPQAAGGGYAGHHPHDSTVATAELERLRREGAEYLVLPSTALWWLEFYEGFAEHLSTHCELVADVPQTCLIYGLIRHLEGESAAQLAGQDGALTDMRDYLENLIADDAHLVVLEAGEQVGESLAPLHADGLAAPRLQEAPAGILGELARLANDGADYLIVPRAADEWLAGHMSVAAEIESGCRKVADQRFLCRVFELGGLRSA